MATNDKKPRQGLSKEEMKAEIRSRIEAAAETKQLDRFLTRQDVNLAVGVGNLQTYLKEHETNFAATIGGKDQGRKKKITDLTKYRKPIRRKRRGKLKS
ncbi:hypothetical protein PN499_05385 [Kamptonema animale CS-326]|uniref:hypothetical protein n=1 Tax=Kamptonema animale TaxID=92934 RepID=UPI00232D482C|nr:hypothetical protein [Kamptonema animale]MDB9510609.1 hypothetical protein [Kamptonema animale CS-326]